MILMHTLQNPDGDINEVLEAVIPWVPLGELPSETLHRSRRPSADLRTFSSQSSSQRLLGITSPHSFRLCRRQAWRQWAEMPWKNCWTRPATLCSNTSCTRPT